MHSHVNQFSSILFTDADRKMSTENITNEEKDTVREKERCVRMLLSNILFVSLLFYCIFHCWYNLFFIFKCFIVYTLHVSCVCVQFVHFQPTNLFRIKI